jgi:hypothetical protein
MKQKPLTYTFYYWGAFCRGAFIQGAYVQDNYGKISNRSGLGHPVFLAVLLIKPTEMLQ